MSGVVTYLLSRPWCGIFKPLMHSPNLGFLTKNKCTLIQSTYFIRLKSTLCIQSPRRFAFLLIRSSKSLFTGRYAALYFVPFSLTLRNKLFFVAKCQNEPSRLNHLKSNSTNKADAKFDWTEFWNILKPDVLLLLIAAAVSDI